MNADGQYRVARLLVAALAESGVEIAAIGAGSRSTPLTLAFADDGRIKCVSQVDERSAAFFALGAARVSGRPVAVVSTSGTAVAELLPAVTEARAAGVPLVCVTADRPPELQDVGATQTVDQRGLLSPCRWTFDLLACEDDALTYAAHVGARAVANALGPAAGPVHINVRLREPLTPSVQARAEVRPEDVLAAVSDSILVPDDASIERVAAVVRSEPRGILYVGHVEGLVDGLGAAVSAFARASGWPVMLEATSRLRGAVADELVIDAADAVVRSGLAVGDRAPQAVLRLGRSPLTRTINEWLRNLEATQVVLTRDLPWPDANRDTTEVLVGDPLTTLVTLTAALESEQTESAPGTWTTDWVADGRAAREGIDAYLDATDTAMFEGTVARSVGRTLPDDGLLWVGTSLPIRALESFTPANRLLEAYAHRGASGIDGTLAAALGARTATGRPTVCLAGDLAFLYDVGALMVGARHRIPLVIVVIDNGGGGIFEHLPQAEAVEREEFDDLFVTRHELDLMRAAELFGFQFAATRDAASLEKSLSWALAEGGSWVIRVPVRGNVSVVAHAEAVVRAGDAVRQARGR